MPLEYFYTLPCVEKDRILWRIEPRLKRHIEMLCQIIQPVNYPVNDPLEAAIAQYLFGQLRQHPNDELIRTHWMAFLLRRCEIVAKRILPLLGDRHHIGFDDLFMMASIAAIDPLQFLRNFDESRVQLGCWYPTFIKFTDIKLRHLLLPELRRETGNHMFGQSNLGLVARSSRKRVSEALERSGYGNAQIDRYLLAWQCFQEYTDSVNRRFNQFNGRDFQNIATRYNELNQSENSVSGSEIQTWLDNIGEAIRRLSDPPRNSFWTRFSFQSDEETNLLENIPFETSYDDEMAEKISAFMQAIANLLHDVKEKQQILFLNYGLELIQKEIAVERGINQSTVSRRISGLIKRIRSGIWEWFQRKPQSKKISKEELAGIEAGLYQHYSEIIDRFVQNAIPSVNEESWELLNLFYLVQQPLSEIGNMFQRTEEEVRDRLNAILQQLCSNILAQIQAEFKLELQPEGEAFNALHAIVETRLPRVLQYLH